MKMLALAALVAAMAAFVGGCSKDSLEMSGSSDGQVKDAKTPKEAMSLYQDSILSGNRQQFESVIEAPPEQKKFVGDTFPMATAVVELTQAMVKEYGQEAVDKASKSSGTMMDSKDLPKDKKWAEAWTIKEEGDKATASREGLGRNMKLVKVDGNWKIDVGSKLDANEIAQAREVMTKMAEVIKNARSKVGKSGYSAEKIGLEFKAEMTKALMSAMTQGRQPQPQ